MARPSAVACGLVFAKIFDETFGRRPQVPTGHAEHEQPPLVRRGARGRVEKKEAVVTLGQATRTIRQEAGLTQKELGRTAGIEQSYLSMNKRHRSRP